MAANSMLIKSQARLQTYSKLRSPDESGKTRRFAYQARNDGQKTSPEMTTAGPPRSAAFDGRAVGRRHLRRHRVLAGRVTEPANGGAQTASRKAPVSDQVDRG